MKVSIIGTGTMGCGIAQVFAQSNFVEIVYLTDIDIEIAKNGKSKIEKNLKKLVAKNKMTIEASDAILNRIVVTSRDELSDVDLVVEAAIEDISIKKQIFKELDAICKEQTIFATNTSSLSITEIGNGINRSIIGMHFFNPAPVMNLVEVTSGLNTPTEIIDKIFDISYRLGKVPVKVNEAPGFVVNRILIPMINEAVFVFSEGTASADDIDTAMKFGANHPMGPLALGDLIGLDVVLAIMEVIHQETGDDKYRPAPLLRKMVRAGKLGRKTGEGFFKY